ncbi:MAG: RagB/SusD family nutrient uptake outer membrane protein [Gemmatimonadota bacterium]|nr:RagB/SusD family nutrient uptake outer membrane protein [Gemmatimonadota bacterium]
MNRTRLFKRIGVRLLVPVAACSTLLLMGCDVKNPGAILDADLSNELTFQALVAGMSGDLSSALDEMDFVMSRASDELTGSGSYFLTGLVRRGIVNREDINFHWGAPHRARWVAESGIERMREIMDDATFNASPLVARAYLYAALAHRISGECLCYAVIDGSGVMDHKVHFDSAIVRANEAIRIGQAAGLTDVVTAAHGVKAQAYVGLGNWAQAVTEAGMLTTGFEYDAKYSDNSGREENVMYIETHNRAEMSAYGTYAATFPEPGDPRAPWIDCTVTPRPIECTAAQGADGITPQYLQRKYSEYGTEIPVVKGVEMRLIEAEAELNGAANLSTFVGFVNQARAEYGLAPLAAPTTANDAWIMLDDERQLTLWIEARRWHDAHRWDAAGLSFMPAVQYILGLTSTPYALDPSIQKRATCFPISLDECLTNPNVKDAPECQGSF